MRETQGLDENKLEIKRGDVVITCEHEHALREGSSWFRLPENTTAYRADASPIKPRWARACPQCMQKAGGDPNRVAFGRDYVHDGSEIVLLHPKN